MRIQTKVIVLLLAAALLAACGPSTERNPNAWLTYLDTTYGFHFNYPPEGQITSRQDGYARIDGLPIVPNTTLVEKYLEVNVSPEAYPCPSPNVNTESDGGKAQELSLNGLTFLEQKGGGVATGNIYDWVSYSTRKGTVCASLTFVLHYTDPANYVDPPAVFDPAAEQAVFADILASFRWPDR
jgi:hypothetical protein